MPEHRLGTPRLRARVLAAGTMPVTVITTVRSHNEWVPGDHSWTMCAEHRGKARIRQRHAAHVAEMCMCNASRPNGCFQHSGTNGVA
jgi:hypothetical protein